MPLTLAHDVKIDPSRDSLARQDFISTLRGHILTTMANDMKQRFEDTVSPAFERAKGRAPQTQDEVHAAMRKDLSFKFYSAVRVNAQEMVWRSVIPAIEQNMAVLEQRADAAKAGAKGSLTLNPALAIPSNVGAVDVHLMPGGYALDAGLAPGAIYDAGLAVFSAGFMGKNLDDIGQSMANYVKHKFPDFKPARILDVGCTIGHNSTAWAETFPAAEVHAVDVAGPVVAYGNARAESLGLSVHFHQMDARKLDFADNSMDVVFTSMFLHELSVKDIKAFMAEAHRVLRPGGLFLTMELPPNHELQPYDQFYLDWDCYYNNEPFYRTYRDQKPADLTSSGGFADEAYFQFTVPQFSYMPEADFVAAVNNPPEIGGDTGRLSDSVQWFGFGAWKAAH
jgi:ubiquinone/menaquinone biosynthesis C-methylase UbiE